jgi:GT2 family glycosyltransferase
MLAFFSTVIKTSIINEVGLLDETFGLGYGDDDDYSQRVLKANYKVVHVPSTFVHHYHHVTFESVYSKKELAEMRKKNLALYKNKHK